MLACCLMAEAAQRQPRITKAQLTRAQILRIASEAIAHPETVVKALDGKSVRGDVGIRITEAINRLGIRVPT